MLLALAAALLAGGAAHAAWVKDEVRLNLRTGPGTGFRILGAIKTGDSVDILERGDGWTRVRVNGVDEGWIPAGFLQVEPPAAVQLERREAETLELRRQVSALSAEAEKLRVGNAELSEKDTEQEAQLAALTQENIELRAGARWPDRLAGAAIFAAGMLVGALLQRRNARRQSPRIRL